MFSTVTFICTMYLYVIIPYYIEFNGPVMASMKIKTVQIPNESMVVHATYLLFY